MIRVWIVSFILLFGSAELWQWLQQYPLPLPVFIVAGAFLAIASNFDKLSNLPFHPDYDQPKLDASAQSSDPVLQEDESESQLTPKPSISFEIRKPFQPGD
jgi:hypothetical protein